MATILHDIVGEVHENVSAGLHPTVSALVDGFLNYLKEPRYQNPLSLTELASLFASFYVDLNSLAINIYTQLNTNKRLLLTGSEIFKKDLKLFDYLLAIASYSASSIKLVKRSDARAMFQLRVFAYYKFLTIIDTIEKAQYDLFCSSNPGDKSTLYDKIFRFDERDISIQKLLSEKIRILRNLNLPLSCFCESSDKDENVRLDEFFLVLSEKDEATLEEIKASLKLLSHVRTPSTKLKYIVKTQKLLILLLSSFYNNDTSKVNSDILLPALIYVIIYHLSDDEEEENDLFLNFTFVKSFLNLIEPYKVDATIFTLNTPLSSYNPTEKKRSFARADRKALKSNLYELLNLSEANVEEDLEEETENFKGLQSDKDLIHHLQTNYLNNGELQYYLTNFEAILYFLLNSTIEELVPEGFTIPQVYHDNVLMTMSLHKIIEERTKDEKAVQASQEYSKTIDEELGTNRSRSSSLFNTITSAVSQSVSQSVTRSRSNSGQVRSPGGSLNREIFPHTTDFESSIYASPLASNDRPDYGIGRMRNILGRIGLVSNIQFKALEEDEAEDLSGSSELHDTRTKRSTTLLDKISPHQSRTRSESLENSGMGSNSTIQIRKPSLTTKFSNGVSEFMTKLSTAATVPAPPAIASLTTSGRESNTSLHSYADNSPFEDPATGAKRAEIGERTSSMHTMDQWFNNITNTTEKAEPAHVPTHQPRSSNASNAYTTVDSNFNEGSVFSASFGELMKYQHIDFETLTISDLKIMKGYYDQLCSEFMSTKTGSKTSNEYLPEEENFKDQTSI